MAYANSSRFWRKSLRYGLIILIIISLNFMIPRMMPGDPIITIMGEDAGRASPELLQQVRAHYGLDRSTPEQFVVYLQSLANLDLGYSFEKHSPVSSLIADRLPWTLALLLPAIVISAFISLSMGSISGLNRGRNVDRVFTSAFLLVFALPSFFLGMVAISVFSFHLGWFPIGNMASGGKQGLDYAADVAYHLFLPVMVLALASSAAKFLVVRGSVTQISHENFITAARARGLEEGRITYHHVLRNVLPPFLAMLALSIGYMVEGAIIIEIVFSLNGMGTLIYEAVLARDYPLMEGCFLVLAISVLLANLAVDILYVMVDPRTRDPEGSH
jgi:peptide/nickel transport system permease protein